MNKGIIRGITILGILFCLFWIGKNFYQNYQLKKDFKITNGQINDITNVLRQNNNWYLSYEYFVNDKKYNGSGINTLCGSLTLEKLRLLLVNKSFPVAYSTKDTTQSVMILTQKDAEMFNYKIPDSLLIYDSILTCK